MIFCECSSFPFLLTKQFHALLMNQCILFILTKNHFLLERQFIQFSSNFFSSSLYLLILLYIHTDIIHHQYTTHLSKNINTMNENSQMSTIQVKTQHSKESNALHQLLRSIKSIQSNKTNQQSHSPPNSSPISKDTSFNSSISINSTDRMDMTCPICYERMRDPSKANNCFHMFCFDCIVRWCKQKLVCPLCKGSVSII